jgi:hypothetical protein
MTWNIHVLNNFLRIGIYLIFLIFSRSLALTFNVSSQQIILSPCKDNKPYVSSVIVGTEIFTACQYNGKYEVSTMNWKNKTKSTTMQNGKFISFIDDTYLVHLSNKFLIYDINSKGILKNLNLNNIVKGNLEYGGGFYQQSWKLIEFRDVSKPRAISYLVFNTTNGKHFYRNLNECKAWHCETSLLLDTSGHPWISIQYYDIDSGAVTVRKNEGSILIDIINNKSVSIGRNILAISDSGFISKSSSFFGCDPSTETISYFFIPTSLDNRIFSKDLLIQESDNPCGYQPNDIIAASFYHGKVNLISDTGFLQYKFNPFDNSFLLLSTQPHAFDQVVSPESSLFIFAARGKEICLFTKASIQLLKCFGGDNFRHLNLPVEFFRESANFLYIYDSPPISGGTNDPFIFTVIKF